MKGDKITRTITNKPTDGALVSRGYWYGTFCHHQCIINTNSNKYDKLFLTRLLSGNPDAQTLYERNFKCNSTTNSSKNNCFGNQ